MWVTANGSGWLVVYALTSIIGAIAGMGLGKRLFPPGEKAGA